MRGSDDRAGSLFSYVDLEARVPSRHPLRLIRAIVNEALEALSGDFSKLYSRIGRPADPAGAFAAGSCCCRRSTRSARSAS